jgi:hypothetical protein
MRKSPIFACSMCAKTQTTNKDLVLVESEEFELDGKICVDKLYICLTCNHALEKESLADATDWCSLRIAEIAVSQYIKRQLRVFSSQRNDTWRNPR